MFPNYCFRKPPTDYGYDTMYLPKGLCQQRCQSRPRQRTKLFRDEDVPLQVLQEHNQGMRPTNRTVEFRLPASDQKKPVRETGGFEKPEREYRQKQQQQQQQQMEHQQQYQEAATFSGPGSQEACVDFFNTLQDNVLDSVHGVIEHMVGKHFGEILSRLDHLVSQLHNQEQLLKEHSTDVMAKFKDQDDTSLNQFKFVAQMLIDNQTVFYKTLRNQSRQKSFEKSWEDPSGVSEVNETPTQETDWNVEEHSARRPQYRLCEQQDFGYFPRQAKTGSSNSRLTKSTNSNSLKSGTMRRRGRSMPDLRSNALFPTNRGPSARQSKLCTQAGTLQRGSQTTQSASAGGTRKCRCSRNDGGNGNAKMQPVSPGRKQRSLSKTLQGLDDVRFHR